MKLLDTIRRNISADGTVAQPTLAPTRKVTAEWIGTVITIVIMTVYTSVFGEDLDPVVAAIASGAIVGFVGGAAAWKTRERKQ